jgi:hypothetical protein
MTRQSARLKYKTAQVGGAFSFGQSKSSVLTSLEVKPVNPSSSAFKANRSR